MWVSIVTRPPGVGCVAIVVVGEAIQARPCFDRSLALSYVLVCVNDTATKFLMVSLCTVVLHVLLDCEAKMLLPKGNGFIHALRAR